MSSTVKTATWLMSLALIVLGVLGFVSDPVLGLFTAGTTLTLVHLLTGVIGIVAAISGESYARLYLIVLGLAYGAMSVLGFFNGSIVLGFFTVNQADTYLHTTIALVALIVGFSSGKRA